MFRPRINTTLLAFRGGPDTVLQRSESKMNARRPAGLHPDVPSTAASKDDVPSADGMAHRRSPSTTADDDATKLGPRQGVIAHMRTGRSGRPACARRVGRMPPRAGRLLGKIADTRRGCVASPGP